jgi:hypothetical protein
MGFSCCSASYNNASPLITAGTFPLILFGLEEKSMPKARQGTGSRVLRCQLCQHQMTPVPPAEPPLGASAGGGGLQFGAPRPNSPPRSAVCPTYGAPGSPPRSSYPPGYGTSPSYYQQAQGAANIFPINTSVFWMIQKMIALC